MVEEASSQSRDAVISAANLLLVSLLKLNRALVPALLRWVRGQRENWIRQASTDIYYDLVHHPGKRFLCVGQCCLSTYMMHSNASDDRAHESDGFDDDESDSDSDPDTSAAQFNRQQQPSPSSASVVVPVSNNNNNNTDNTTRTTGTGFTSTTPLTNTQQQQGSNNTARDYGATERNITIPTIQFSVPNSARAMVARSLGQDISMSMEERYFRLLVMQEERHRSQMVIPVAYQSVLSAWFTVITLILYSLIIISIVWHFFPMGGGEAVTFAFSLVATATVSEADKLLQAIRKKKTTVKTAVVATNAISREGGGAGLGSNMNLGADGSTFSLGNQPDVTAVQQRSVGFV